MRRRRPPAHPAPPKVRVPGWLSQGLGTVVAGTVLVFAASAATHGVAALPPFHPVVWEMPSGDRCYAFAGRLSCFQPQSTKESCSTLSPQATAWIP